MSPTTSDFSQIVELQEFRRLYEEQEEKIKLRLAEKDQEIEQVRAMVTDRDRQVAKLQEQIQQLGQEREKMRADYSRLRQEAQDKIDKLMERIKELNTKLVGEEKKGIFR